MSCAKKIIDVLSVVKFDLHNEKSLQEQVFKALISSGVNVQKEYRLDKENIPDFYVEGIAIEAKIKGSRPAIFKQCSRYCGFEQVKELILITNRSMGFPDQINGKPCYTINLGKAWL